jgi:hypothetical protein
MGTITRTFANNITTSGVFKPTAFNNASFDNVTSVPEGAVEGGNMVLLSTQTATTGTASISFTSGLTSTYKEYMFIFNNIHPSDDGDALTFNLSTDGGSNYNVTKTTTNFGAYHRENDEAPAFSYFTSHDLAQSTSDQVIHWLATGADADQSLSGTMQLFNPSSTTYVKHFISRSFTVSASDYAGDGLMAGYANTTSAVNAIIFRMQTGNIDAGTIQMFGIL